jgi:hypothetical protein
MTHKKKSAIIPMVMILFKLQAYSFVDLKGYDEWNWLWIAQS